MKGPPARVHFSRLSDLYPRRALWRAADMSLSDRERAGASEVFSLTVVAEILTIAQIYSERAGDS